jgi:hypothetical protein
MLTFSRFLLEGNPLSRIHTTGGAGRHIAIISSDRPNLSAEQLNARRQELKTNLRKQGYGYRPAVGHWEGSKENSLVVNAKKRGANSGKHLVRDMSAHGRKYDQDSILHHNPETKVTRVIGTNKTGYPGFKKQDNKLGRLATNKPEQSGQTEFRAKSNNPLKAGRTAGTGKKLTTSPTN